MVIKTYLQKKKCILIWLPGQKIVAFSYYGDPNSELGKQRKYFEGIERNLKLVLKYYPGIRLFVNLKS
jgi:hypothetical protein